MEKDTKKLLFMAGLGVILAGVVYGIYKFWERQMNKTSGGEF